MSHGVPSVWTAADIAALNALPEPEPIGPLNTFPDDSASTPRVCRAITGDILAPPWRCCGQPVALGRSYCPTHVVKFVDLFGAAADSAHRFVAKGAAGKVLG